MTTQKIGRKLGGGVVGVKGEIVPLHDTKAYRRRGGGAPLIRSLSEWST